ncbi:Peptidase family M23 [Raineyella antarctica]|uniref:Peptidase family M23 n=1 Tax=Raineyella antarctica TaxID=1577474 RepID=A0A1G6GE16_9ACTN|nr:GH25 family lysozyme [Raineyella antarctica]SDB80073.1 Peptidase family M23 [Raineyella antarctica]
MLTGIDVSSHQGPSPDWRGSQVVGVKATQGVSYTNPHWKAQVNGSRAIGARTIHYHYPNLSRDGALEARFFLDTIQPLLSDTDVLCLDWEWYDQSNADILGSSALEGRTPQQVAALVAQRAREYRAQFAAEVRRLAPGRRLLLYCDRNIWTTVDDTSDALDGLWIADPDNPAGVPGIKHPWVGHQCACDPVDQDVWAFDSLAAWDEWALGGAPIPPDPPQPEPPPPEPTPDDGQNRDWPAGASPWTTTLTLQRLQKAARQDDLTGEDHVHRVQACASIRATLDLAQDTIMPPQGTPWTTHFRYYWSAWQRSLGYTGADADGVPGETSVYRLTERIGLRYWDADRQRDTPSTPTSGRVDAPVPGCGVSTPYGKRKAGLWPAKGYHTGDDYACPEGTPVVAVRPGTVTVRDDGVLGCIAILSADNGRHYWYCHLLKGSRVTGPVEAGQVIAKSSDTGTGARGKHLHFEDNASPTTWGTDRRPDW